MKKLTGPRTKLVQESGLTNLCPSENSTKTSGGGREEEGRKRRGEEGKDVKAKTETQPGGEEKI